MHNVDILQPFIWRPWLFGWTNRAETFPDYTRAHISIRIHLQIDLPVLIRCLIGSLLYSPLKQSFLLLTTTGVRSIICVHIVTLAKSGIGGQQPWCIMHCTAWIIFINPPSSNWKTGEAYLCYPTALSERISTALGRKALKRLLADGGSIVSWSKSLESNEDGQMLVTSSGNCNLI